MLGPLAFALLICSSQGINVKKIKDSQDDAQAAQKALCQGVAPQITCMTKTYNWGMVWLHGLGNGASSQMYQNVLVPQMLSLSGVPAGTGLSVFPQAPKMFVESDQLTEQSWHQQETKVCNVSYKPPHHGYSLEDGLQNVQIVHDGIKKLQNLGIPANRIFLAGHSQGGSMVYLSAMKYPEKLAGAINLSGGLLGWWQIDKMMHPANKGLPMMWIRGKDDFIVPQEHQNEIKPMLQAAGFPVECAYLAGGHDITDPRVFGHVSSFINRHLSWNQPLKAFEETFELHTPPPLTPPPMPTMPAMAAPLLGIPGTNPTPPPLPIR